MLRRSGWAAQPPAPGVLATAPWKSTWRPTVVRATARPSTSRPTEFALLEQLITHPNKVLSHRLLLQRVWGSEYHDEAEYLRVYMGRLRRKLERDRPTRAICKPSPAWATALCPRERLRHESPWRRVACCCWRCLAGLAACAGPDLRRWATAAEAGGPPLVFGATISITGPTAKEGEYTRDGYLLAVNEINTAGGIRVGDKHYRVALQYYDDQSDPAARAAALPEIADTKTTSISCSGPIRRR